MPSGTTDLSPTAVSSEPVIKIKASAAASSADRRQKKAATSRLIQSAKHGSNPNSGPDSLSQSARRRLQYNNNNTQQQHGSSSQLPVRSASKGSIQTAEKANKAQQQQQPKSATLRKIAGKPNAQDKKKTNAAVPRKSMSLLDLSPAASKLTPATGFELRGCDSALSVGGLDSASYRQLAEELSDKDSLILLQRQNNPHHRLSKRLGSGMSGLTQAEREWRAGQLVARGLMLHAWRQRRREVRELKTSLSNLEQQSLQIVVLRRLLHNENARVARMSGDLHRLRAHSEDINKELQQLKAEKETMLSEAQKLKELAEERAINAENLRNELGTERDRLAALDKQIAKDRDKLLKSREDKKSLLDKVAAFEALIEEKTKKAECAERAREEMQVQLDTQLALNASLQEEIQRFAGLVKEKQKERTELEKTLRELEDENMRLEERLQSSEQLEHELSLQAADFKCQLLHQDAKIRQMDQACKTYRAEIMELQASLLKYTEESGWSSKLFRFAGNVARYPHLIMRTLSFFLTGLPLVWN
ncbi:golgin subfamily A member 6-like protein 2 [Trichogramma pretiosum]|uniref:golgin subfamily A member 6-like protein 2 n=1 Tax=Trichogramma pretiosum TaxID=7493 RepID=UPI0006C9C05D|nr:golgin subfamily A member 6-like protein 2 [Trichogramma pretiosum]